MSDTYRPTSADRQLAREGMQILKRVKSEAESIDSFHDSCVEAIQRDVVRRNRATLLFYSTSPLTRSVVASLLKRLGWRCVTVSTLVDLGAECKKTLAVAPLAAVLIDAITDEHPKESLSMLRTLAKGIPVMLLTEIRSDSGKGFNLIPKWIDAHHDADNIARKVIHYRGTLSQREGYALGFDVVFASPFTVAIAELITTLFLTTAGRSRDSILAASNHLKIRTMLSDVTDRFFTKPGPQYYEELGKQLESEHQKILDSLSATGHPSTPTKKNPTKAEVVVQRVPTPELDLIDTHPTFVILQGKYEHTQQVLFSTQKELANRNFQLSEIEMKLKKCEDEKAAAEDALDDLRRSVETAAANPQLAKERLEMMQRRAFDTTRIKSLEGLVRATRQKLDEAESLADVRLKTIRTLEAELSDAKEKYVNERAALENMLSKLNETRDEEGRKAVAENQRRDMELRFRRREVDSLRLYVATLNKRIEKGEAVAMQFCDFDSAKPTPAEPHPTQPARVMEMRPLYLKAIQRPKTRSQDAAVQTVPQIANPPTPVRAMRSTAASPNHAVSTDLNVSFMNQSVANAPTAGLMSLSLDVPLLVSDMPISTEARRETRDVALSPIYELIERSTRAAMEALRAKAFSSGVPTVVPNVSISQRASRRQSMVAKDEEQMVHRVKSPVSVKSEGEDDVDTPLAPEKEHRARRRESSRRQSRVTPSQAGDAQNRSFQRRSLNSSRGEPAAEDPETSFGHFRLRSKSTAFDAPFIDPHAVRPLSPRASFNPRPPNATRTGSIVQAQNSLRLGSAVSAITTVRHLEDKVAKRAMNPHAKYNPTASKETIGLDSPPNTVLGPDATEFDLNEAASVVSTCITREFEKIAESTRRETENDINALSGLIRHLRDMVLLRVRPFTKQYLYALQTRSAALSDTMDDLLLDLPADQIQLEERARTFFAAYQERKFIKTAIDEVSKATSSLGMKEKETLVRRRGNALRRFQEMGPVFISQGDFVSYSDVKSELLDVDSQLARWLTEEERSEELGSVSNAVQGTSSSLEDVIDSTTDEKLRELLSEIQNETVYHGGDALLTSVRRAAITVMGALQEKLSARQQSAPGMPLYPQHPLSLYKSIEEEAQGLAQGMETREPFEVRFNSALDSLRAQREKTMSATLLTRTALRRIDDVVSKYQRKTHACVREYERREEVTRQDLKKRGVDLRLFNDAVDLGFLKKLQSPNGYYEVTPGSLMELFDVHHKHLKRLLKHLKDRSPLTNVKIVDAALQEKTMRIEMLGGEAKASTSIANTNVPFVLAADTALVARFADYFQEETEGQFRNNRARYKKYCETLTYDVETQTDAVRMLETREGASPSRESTIADQPTTSLNAYNVVFGQPPAVSVTTFGGEQPVQNKLPKVGGAVILPGRKLALGGKLTSSSPRAGQASVSREGQIHAARIATAESRMSMRERREQSESCHTDASPTFGVPQTARTPVLPTLQRPRM